MKDLKKSWDWEFLTVTESGQESFDPKILVFIWVFVGFFLTLVVSPQSRFLLWPSFVTDSRVVLLLGQHDKRESLFCIVYCSLSVKTV